MSHKSHRSDDEGSAHSFSFRLNGETVHVENVATQTTLLDYVRSRNLTGAKEGCAEGECGACAVALVKARDGACAYVPCNSCLFFCQWLQARRFIRLNRSAGQTTSTLCRGRWPTPAAHSAATVHRALQSVSSRNIIDPDVPVPAVSIRLAAIYAGVRVIVRFGTLLCPLKTHRTMCLAHALTSPHRNRLRRISVQQHRIQPPRHAFRVPCGSTKQRRRAIGGW